MVLPVLNAFERERVQPRSPDARFYRRSRYVVPDLESSHSQTCNGQVGKP